MAVAAASTLMDPDARGSRTERRELIEESIRLHLEERLRPSHPGQPVPAQASEADAGRGRTLDCGLGLAGHDDLAAVGRTDMPM